MNDKEREVIILNSAWEMIDGMVNWALFVKNEQTVPTILMFQTEQSSRLFIILLGDFLSEIRAFKGDPVPLGLKAAPNKARPSDLTFLFHLRQVCANPNLGSNVVPLREAVESFASWLEGEFVAEGVNLHSIDVVADLVVMRMRYIKMCGDIAKHSLARLATNVGHLRKLLEQAGHPVIEQDAYLAVETFFEWFHGHIFSYHSSQIAEFLNAIRWSIYDYLQLEFRRSWHLTDKATPDFAHYSYRIPSDISEPIARAMYWDVMNRSRSRPYVQRSRQLNRSKSITSRFASMPITMYGIKNCETMKKARAWLESRGVAYQFHDYKAAGIDRSKLAAWAGEVGWKALLNRAGTTFRALSENDKNGLTEKKAIALMVTQPSMIKRPVLDVDGNLFVGFKVEDYAKAFPRAR